MAVTRKLLKALGIEEDKIDQIIEAHTETVDGLKAQIDKLKPEEKPEAKDGEGKPAKDSGEDPFKAQIDELKNQIAALKQEQKDKETKHAKETAYKALLKECNVSDKRINAILKVTDLDGFSLEKDGSVKDKDNLVKSIKDEWADFIETTQTKGAETSHPPKGEDTKDEKSTMFADRYKQYRENLFGKSPETTKEE